DARRDAYGPFAAVRRDQGGARADPPVGLRRPRSCGAPPACDAPRRTGAAARARDRDDVGRDAAEVVLPPRISARTVPRRRVALVGALGLPPRAAASARRERALAPPAPRVPPRTAHPLAPRPRGAALRSADAIAAYLRLAGATETLLRFESRRVARD